MKNRNKKRKEQTQGLKVVKTSFTGHQITRYSGLNSVGEYLKREGIVRGLSELFSGLEKKNALKLTNLQILLSVILASLCGVNRVKHISNFTRDCFVKIQLKLNSFVKETTLSNRLKLFGERGSRILESYIVKRNVSFLVEQNITSITIDTDSTVSSVCGNQEGAEKGFNPTKKGAKSYHPLIAFVAETKTILHTWFRSGSSYTSNGIIEFVKQIKANLPSEIDQVFFRADSGFFNGKLFDTLVGFDWNFLVKVKLKGLVKLLEKQTWVIQNKKISVCTFEYKAKAWSKSYTFMGIRILKGYDRISFFGKVEYVAVYTYICLATNIDCTELEAYELYKQRSTSETWIEQVKGQLRAAKTLTDSFWANDLLWQLSCFSYNISVMMRFGSKVPWRQEHATFQKWFIEVPAMVIKSGR